MINKTLLILFLISLLILESCDETFSPYGKFEQKYSLNCIVRADTNFQVTTLFQSYSSNDNTPSQNRSASFVHNAFIRLWRGNDDIYVLKDSTIKESDTLHTSTPINFYYAKNFVPHQNDNLEIEVLLPNGNRLRSKTKVPDLVIKDLVKTSASIPPISGNMVTFAWRSSEADEIFVPTLFLIYRQKVGERLIQKKVQIPWKYVNENGEEVGINRPPTRNQLVQYSMENIERVLKSISEGDNNKNNYFILSALLEIKIFDRNLSAYYLSTGRITDIYSVSLDSQDYSNINGGFGVFGSILEQKMAILFDNDYLAKFGYQNAL